MIMHVVKNENYEYWINVLDIVAISKQYTYTNQDNVSLYDIVIELRNGNNITLEYENREQIEELVKLWQGMTNKISGIQ